MSTSPLSSESFLTASATQRWIKDICRFLPVKSQFILSGNVRDRFPFPLEGGGHVPLPLMSYVAEVIRLCGGYTRFLSYNPIDGFEVLALRGEAMSEVISWWKDHFKLNFDSQGHSPCSLEKSLEVIERVASWRDNFAAVFCDFASRYAVQTTNLTPQEHAYFTKVLMLGHEVREHATAIQSFAQFNPIFWVCDRENDLPAWLSLANPRVRSVVVPLPDHLVRRAVVTAISPSVLGQSTCTTQERQKHDNDFVEQTEALAITDLIAITRLARRENLAYREIGEAVRRYKLGVTEDPWRRIDHDRIVGGEEFIRMRVKGQTQAVTKALDIVKRAVTGLSGSQGSRISGKPRGVMFLAGPTGVGKTELAKTLTELLFGDERAYIRFDMSEFSAEHAADRLVGAPPGYVGFDAGGELTNAIREKPFAVVLFDEIEKAHPRILDKFLQLLDDGVLTSGRGERVYFSESVIIFTSNLGIYQFDDSGARVLNVSPEMPYVKVAQRVRAEIGRYFKEQLNRPEILNRIGENIVVFDFIRPEVAVLIFEKMRAGILARVADAQKISVTLSAEVEITLRDYCIKDLSNGGRGVGNQLEAWLINPLARALFDGNYGEGSAVTVTTVTEVAGVPTLTLVRN